jgi:hypothetical protein
MGASSEVQITFLPLPELAAEIRSLKARLAPVSDLGQIIKSLHLEEVREAGQRMTIIFTEVKDGSDHPRVQRLAELLQAQDLAFSIFDGGCQPAWDANTAYWRPGMPKPVKNQVDVSGDLVLNAKEVIQALADYPEAMVALEDRFDLGGLSTANVSDALGVV